MEGADGAVGIEMQIVNSGGIHLTWGVGGGGSDGVEGFWRKQGVWSSVCSGVGWGE